MPLAQESQALQALRLHLSVPSESLGLQKLL
jgi:hypothetical protein